MTIPWVSQSKAITQIAHGTQQTNHPTGFVAPQPAPQISFSPTQLFGSIARVKALVGASGGLTSALASSAESLIRHLVDDATTDFAFTGEVLILADATRTAFSGDVGAGIADRYMERLGYVWRDNARSLVPKGQVADFVYDGPPTTNRGVVLVEAKGSVTATVTARSIATTTINGYQNQVAPYIGQSPAGTTILHGYAVGTGSQPGATASFMRVEETAPVVVSAGTGGTGPSPGATPSVGAAVSAGGSGKKGDGSDGRAERGRPNSQVALGNYRAVFSLINAPNVVRAIDYIRSTPDTISRDLAPQRFIRLQAGDATYLVGSYSHPYPYFGIREEVAAEFLMQLRLGVRPENLQFELPIMGNDQIFAARRSGDVELFADGLAFLNRWRHADVDLDVFWDPMKGKFI